MQVNSVNSEDTSIKMMHVLRKQKQKGKPIHKATNLFFFSRNPLHVVHHSSPCLVHSMEDFPCFCFYELSSTYLQERESSLREKQITIISPMPYNIILSIFYHLRSTSDTLFIRKNIIKVQLSS